MEEPQPILHLAGSKDGLPTLEDLIAMAEAISGRKATPEEIEEARRILAKAETR